MNKSLPLAAAAAMLACTLSPRRAEALGLLGRSDLQTLTAALTAQRCQADDFTPAEIALINQIMEHVVGVPEPHGGRLIERNNRGQAVGYICNAPRAAENRVLLAAIAAGWESMEDLAPCERFYIQGLESEPGMILRTAERGDYASPEAQQFGRVRCMVDESRDF